MSRRVFAFLATAAIVLLVAAPASAEPRVLRLHPTPGAMWLATTDGAWQLDSAGRVARIWRENDGLPSSVVTDLATANDGRLWASTTAGTAWLDGDRFVSASEGLPSTDVLCLLPTRRGTLYAGTGRGIAVYDGQRWQPRFDVHQFGRDRVLSAAEAADGSVWFAKIHSLASFAPDGTATVMWRDPLNPDRAVPLASTAAQALAFDARGRLWIATDSGLSVVVGGELEREWRWRPPPWGEAGLPGQRVWTVFHDQRGRTWIGFGDGADTGRVARLDADAGNWQVLPIPGHPEAAVYDFAEDAEQRVWLATSSGIFRMDGDEAVAWPLTEGQ